MPTLDWLNRAQAFTLAARVPYRLLEEVSVHTAAAPDEAATPPALPAQADLLETEAAPAIRPGATRGNLLIQGDNLEAIKALLPFYRGHPAAHQAVQISLCTGSQIPAARQTAQFANHSAKAGQS